MCLKVIILSMGIKKNFFLASLNFTLYVILGNINFMGNMGNIKFICSEYSCVDSDHEKKKCIKQSKFGTI